MDDLAHQPEIFLHRGGLLAHLVHKLEVQDICTVEADAVDVKRVDPVTDHVKKILFDLRILEIQARKLKMPLPCVVSESIPIWRTPSEVHVSIPATVSGAFTIFLNILKSKKFSSGVVEDTVNNNADSSFVAEFHKTEEIVVVAETAVNKAEVAGVVPMRRGLKERSYVKSGEAQLFHVRNPEFQLLKAVSHALLVVLTRCAGHSQRIHVIKYSFFIPSAHTCKSS